MQWQPIETAPRNCTLIIATIPVYRASDGSFMHWETHVIAFDNEVGEMVEDFGWPFDDYHFWMPLPPPPAKGK